MAGRDDDYMLDFKFRLETTLNFYGRSIEALEKVEQAEVLVTDWGSSTPLSQSLSLTEAAKRITSFVYVPQEIILRTQDGKDFYHIARACNVGLRRARGRYLYLTNTDQIMSSASLGSTFTSAKR